MAENDIGAHQANFDANGFVVIPGFFSATEVATLATRATAAISRLPERTDGDFQNVTKGLEKLDPFFDEWLNGGRHLEVLEELIGETPCPATSSYFTKDVTTESIQPHADGSNGGTVWVPLDPIDRHNGGLCFLAGSHRAEREYHFEAGVDADAMHDDPHAVSLELAPGDAVFFRAMTVHWSGINVSGRPRRAINAFYIDLERQRLKWRTDKARHTTEHRAT